MSDNEQVSQALAELWDIVRCRCNEAYTGRGLHDPDCECDSAEAVKIVADRIEALGKACTEWAEVSQSNYQRAKAAEAKLAKAVEALQWCAMYGDGDVALATLAEIKGGNDAKSDL